MANEQTEPDLAPRRETRLEAAKAGRFKYIATPCKVCGCELRYTSNGNCPACSIERAKSRDQEIRDLLRKAMDDGADEEEVRSAIADLVRPDEEGTEQPGA